MASETVDPIYWSHPPPYTGQYPLSFTYCTVQCRLQITSLSALSEPRTCDLRNAKPTHCLCGRSLYKLHTGWSMRKKNVASEYVRVKLWGARDVREIKLRNAPFKIIGGSTDSGWRTWRGCGIHTQWMMGTGRGDRAVKSVLSNGELGLNEKIYIYGRGSNNCKTRHSMGQRHGVEWEVNRERE